MDPNFVPTPTQFDKLPTKKKKNLVHPKSPGKFRNGMVLLVALATEWQNQTKSQNTRVWRRWLKGCTQFSLFSNQQNLKVGNPKRYEHRISGFSHLRPELYTKKKHWGEECGNTGTPRKNGIRALIWGLNKMSQKEGEKGNAFSWDQQEAWIRMSRWSLAVRSTHTAV